MPDELTSSNPDRGNPDCLGVAGGFLFENQLPQPNQACKCCNLRKQQVNFHAAWDMGPLRWLEIAELSHETHSQRTVRFASGEETPTPPFKRPPSNLGCFLQ